MSESNYSKKQIKFIMNLKKRGATYREIAKKFGRTFGVKKSVSSVEYIFRKYRDDYDLSGLKSHVEIKSEVIISRMLEDFVNLVNERKYVPIQAEFVSSCGYSQDQIKRYFSSFENLEKQAREKSRKAFKGIIDDTSFNADAFKSLREDVSNHQRFVITTAVTGCEPHEDGLASLQSFCKKNKAKLLVLPCSDPAHTKQHKYNFSLSHKLPIKSVVFRDLSLNKNLFLSTIKLSAKHINPLTGLSRIGQKKGSFIYASPKQFLEHVATSNKKSIPRALMTTGAITVSNYNTDMYLSERTAYIADQDHVLGAIIVEIKNGQVFFFRQIQIDPRTGAFSDIDKQYFPDGSVKKIRAKLVQLPDYHVGETDPVAEKVWKDLVSVVKPKYMTVEDFFNGYSINHHEKHKITTLAKKAQKRLLDLRRELNLNKEKIDELCTWGAEELVMKYGNHEDFLKQWLEDAGYAKEPHNHYVGLCLAKALFEGENPFEHAMRYICGLKDGDKVRFLGINDSFEVDGIENGVHGHIGAGGKRSPGMQGLEKSYGACNVAHNHSAAILRRVFRAGTSSLLQLLYNDGASAWTQTALIQHEDKSRQLISNIFGEYRLD